MGVKIENNLLSVDISKLNISPEDIENILSKYRLKKKFYRLKDGSFLELQDNKEISFINQLISGTDISYQELKNGNFSLPVNRALYLEQLLKELKETLELEKIPIKIESFDISNISGNCK